MLIKVIVFSVGYSGPKKQDLFDVPHCSRDSSPQMDPQGIRQLRRSFKRKRFKLFNLNRTMMEKQQNNVESESNRAGKENQNKPTNEEEDQDIEIVCIKQRHAETKMIAKNKSNRASKGKQK